MAPLAERKEPLDQDVAAFAERLNELVSLLEADPPEDGYAENGWKLLAEQVLDARHAIALALRDLEVHEHEPAAESLEVLAESDLELQTQLWRLTAINPHRQKQLEAVAPEERDDTWWYSRGAHLPAGAVGQLGAVASLAACFPEAEQELALLANAEGLLAHIGAGAELTRSLGSGKATSAPTRRLEEPPSTRPASAPVRRIESPSAEVAAFLEEDHAMPWGENKATPWSRIAWMLSAAAVAVSVGLGFAYKQSAEAAESAEREKAVIIAQSEALKDEAEQSVKRLEAQLKASSTLSEAQKMALEAQLANTRAAYESTERAALDSSQRAVASARSGKAAVLARPAGAKPASSAHPASRAGGAAKPACTPGDPMCGDQ